MLKKTITYKDFDGNERTEDFYFNLTEAEVLEMELGLAGGLVQKLETIIAAQTGEELIKMFKDMVLLAYGEKSPDGKRFVKSPEIRASFAATVPYSIIFMQLATDDELATEFVNGIMPEIKEPNKSTIPAPPKK